jgi:galactokinase/mevalonate kinase-like predicted kinase
MFLLLCYKMVLVNKSGLIRNVQRQQACHLLLIYTKIQTSSSDVVLNQIRPLGLLVNS